MAAEAGPPRIDVETTCRTSENELIKLFGDQTAMTFDSCMHQQNDALERLKKDWASYPSPAKTHCVQTKNYSPSYVEWLTCLEMEQTLKELRAREAEAVPPTQGRR